MAKYKYSIISLILLVLCLNGCNDEKCKSTKKYFNINKKLIEYFGVYKPGNWWQYENSTRTIKDSIYVLKYTSMYPNYGTDICYHYNQIKLTLESTFLFRFNETNDYQMEISVWPENVNTHSIFEINTAKNYRLRLIIEDKNDSFVVYNNSPQFIDSIRINNKYYFDNILITNQIISPNFYIFSKNIGIIQWYNGKDTFLIKNYFVK